MNSFRILSTTIFAAILVFVALATAFLLHKSDDSMPSPPSTEIAMSVTIANEPILSDKVVPRKPDKSSMHREKPIEIDQAAFLIDDLRNGNEYKRKVAAINLGMMRSKEALPALIDVLQDFLVEKARMFKYDILPEWQLEYDSSVDWRPPPGYYEMEHASLDFIILDALK